MKTGSQSVRISGNPKGRYLSMGFIFVPLLLLLSANKLFGNHKPEAKRTTNRIRAIVERFRQELSIRERVFVSVVAKNDKLVSVERIKKRRGGFVLSFDETFLIGLDDNELSRLNCPRIGARLDFHSSSLSSDRAFGKPDRDESRNPGKPGKDLRENMEEPGEG